MKRTPDTCENRSSALFRTTPVTPTPLSQSYEPSCSLSLSLSARQAVMAMVRSFLSRARALNNQDFTVPSGLFNAWAISLTSMWR